MGCGTQGVYTNPLRCYQDEFSELGRSLRPTRLVSVLDFHFKFISSPLIFKNWSTFPVAEKRCLVPPWMTLRFSEMATALYGHADDWPLFSHLRPPSLSRFAGSMSTRPTVCRLFDWHPTDEQVLSNLDLNDSNFKWKAPQFSAGFGRSRRKTQLSNGVEFWKCLDSPNPPKSWYP